MFQTLKYLILGLFRFLLLLITSLSQEIKSSQFSFDLKRIVVLCFLSAIIPLLIVWNYIGLFLDDYLFDNWNSVVVYEPTFIVGNARSGTTWVHRLLALDETMFTSVRTWELLFAVSITWKKLFSSIYIMDDVYLKGSIYYILRVAECYLLYGVSLRCFRRSDYLHVVGLMEVEEDEWLMVYIGYAQLITLFFPLGIHTASLSDVISWNQVRPGDYELAETKNLIFRFFRSCVQKHLFWKQQYMDELAGIAHKPRSRTQLRYLSKNPAFTMRIPALYDEFPDCRVVCLLRDPCASIPSMVSYIAHVWSIFSSPKFKYPEASTLLDFCIAHYMYPCQQLASPLRPENQWAFVYYSDLLVVKDPVSGECRCNLRDTMMQLLDRLYYSNASVTSKSNVKNKALGDILDSEAAASLAKGFRSVHQHSVGQCCNMTEEEFRSKLSIVYKTHTRLDDCASSHGKKSPTTQESVSVSVSVPAVKEPIAQSQSVVNVREPISTSLVVEDYATPEVGTGIITTTAPLVAEEGPLSTTPPASAVDLVAPLSTDEPAAVVVEDVGSDVSVTGKTANSDTIDNTDTSSTDGNGQDARSGTVEKKVPPEDLDSIDVGKTKGKGKKGKGKKK